MKENSNSEIFDYIIETEDSLLNNVRIELKKIAYDKFGDRGVSIVDKYYRQIDGEEEFEDNSLEDCSDCKEKAKKLIEILNYTKEINDILCDDSLNEFCEYVDDIKFEDFLSNIINFVKSKTCVDIDNNEIQKRVKVRILLEIAKKVLTENGTSSNKRLK